MDLMMTGETMIRMKMLDICLLLALCATPLLAQAGGEKDRSDYSLMDRARIPVEFTFNVADIFPDKAAWQKEKERVAGLVGQAAGQAGKWTASAREMLAFLQLTEDIRKSGMRLMSWASLQSDMDLGNNEFRMMRGEIGMYFVRMSSMLSFVNADVIALGSEKFEQYLKEEPELAPYAFGIRDVLRMKPHVLPAEQAKIVSMAGLISGVSSNANGALTNVDLPSPEITLSTGEKVVLNYNNYSRLRGARDAGDRDLTMKTFWANVKKYENTLAILMDGGVKGHYFNATVHGYADCLEAALKPNAIDRKVYDVTVEQVKKNLAPLHRHMALKQKLLGLPTFRYVDMYANSVQAVEKEYTWEEARAIIQTAMQPLGEEYVAALGLAFDNRWIDRYPNKGKQTGAYSSGVYGVHPYIKMNYNGEYDAVSTLAHELGHAMHSWFSNKTQPFATAGYPTFLAEIASTFNEHMMMDYLLANEKDDLLKLYIIDSYLTGLRGTIYRQAMFAEFELAMHKEVESGRTLTAQWLNAKYLELTRHYYGHEAGVTLVEDYIANEWSVIPHFFRAYYVYNYTTGMIASMALAEMVSAGGPDACDRYLTMLKSGGSDYPLELLKRAGVDMTTPAPFDAAFKRYDTLLTEMEKIVERLKAAGKI